jgi:cytochrome o ubiquinol oxidase operon protein cyoD
MSHIHSNPIEHPEVQMASKSSYLIGFIVASLLMLVATFLVSGQMLPPFALLLTIMGCAGLAVIAQVYFLLHIDISQHNIWNTVALVMFIPLFVITIGLTWWMFSQLYMRTMPMIPGMPGMH